MTTDSDPPDTYKSALSERGFDLQEQLGTGATGRVYKAIQRSLNRAVAIKFLDASRITENQRKRFQREALLLALVQHPYVPYVITKGEIKDGPCYIVMEHIAGITLKSRLKSTPAISASEACQIAKHILSALDCVHQQEIVHRDVKPGNIITSSRGAFLIDFSIGVCLNYQPGLTRVTSEKGLGTYDYAAPEQKGDPAAVDGKADIYSVGAVLAEMLGARLRVRLAELDAELHQVPAGLRDIVRRAVAEQANERYNSAAEFLSDLERFDGVALMNLEPRIVLCPNLRCDQAKWSNGNHRYYWGPKIAGPVDSRYCDSCGTEYLRGCPKCSRPLPVNIADFVSKNARSERDARDAHCAYCGTSIFRTPACAKCRSYLTLDDMDSDTAEHGCQKCRSKLRSRNSRRSIPDGDIPF